jgi:Peptidase family M50
MGNGVRSGKWWPVIRSASFSLGALAVVVSLHKLSAAYDLWVDWLWADWAVWFWFGVALGFVWHEAGHLLCATLGALPVRLMSVGVGPLLWSSHIGNVRFDLRLLPIGGMVASYPLLLFRKYRMLVFVLGGILGNCALVAVMVLLALTGAVHERADFALHAVVAAQFFVIATNLFPFRAKVDGVRLPSDGLQVLQLLWAPRKGLTEAGLAYRDMLAPTSAPAISTRTFRRQRHASSISSCAEIYWRTAARCRSTERRWSASWQVTCRARRSCWC